MKIVTLVVASIALYAAGAVDQPAPEIRTGLTSGDPAIRETAARELAAQAPLTAGAKTALVDLLAKENGFVKAASLGTAAGMYGEEGYTEYVGWLVGPVMKIADEEPDRADVWNALLGVQPPSGQSAYGKWLGTHGDKALPYLLKYAADHKGDNWDRGVRTDALTCLAQIVAYERRPDSLHRLSPDELSAIEALIRNGADDPDTLVRTATVTALGIMGDPSDLATLDRIGANDSQVINNGGRSGAETRRRSGKVSCRRGFDSARLSASHHAGGLPRVAILPEPLYCKVLGNFLY